MKLLKLISVLLVGGAGCVGTIDPGTPTPPNPPPAGTAEATFVASVQPMLRGCAGGGSGCHEGADANQSWSLFLGEAGAADDYDKIVSDLNVNGNFNGGGAALLTKLTGPHQGMAAWTQTQIDTISGWLAEEADERGITGGPPPDDGSVNAFQAMERFSGCMDITLWNNANMGTWSQRQANGGTACAGCHNAGAGGLFISANSQITFDNARKEATIFGWFRPIPDPNLPGSNIVEPNYGVFEAFGGPGSTHPDFGYAANNEYMVRLKQFNDAVMAKFLNPADPCRTTPPGYPAP